MKIKVVQGYSRESLELDINKAIESLEQDGFLIVDIKPIRIDTNYVWVMIMYTPGILIQKEENSFGERREFDMQNLFTTMSMSD